MLHYTDHFSPGVEVRFPSEDDAGISDVSLVRASRGQATRSFISYNHPAMEPADSTLGLRHPVERRTFMAMIVGGLLAAPLAAEAQPARKMWRIGVLDPGFGPAGRIFSALRARLIELG